MSEFRDGYKAAIDHFKQLMPMLRVEFPLLQKLYIPPMTGVTKIISGDVLDRAFIVLDDLSNRDNIDGIKTLFQYKPFPEVLNSKEN